MRVISVSVQNFASYKNLKFNFINQGLTLIQGPTGAGKSTLCDLIPWCVWGITAKNGPVSDVLTWPGEIITNAAIHLETKNTALIIRRARGPKAKDNDLYYYEVGGTIIRGKDLNDTQKLINNLLGMDADLYLAGAYYHEFSQTAQFFTTTAKHRRTICEQVVDLSLAKNLQLKLTDKWKSIKSTLGGVRDDVLEIEHRLSVLSRVQETEYQKAKAWEISHEKTKAYVIRNYEVFESHRKHTVKDECFTCGTVFSDPKTVINNAANPHLDRLAELETAVNPHTGSAKDYSEEIFILKAELEMAASRQTALNLELSDIELLQQVTADYRSTSIQRTIQGIEAETNKLLSEHFDAEIRVVFSAQDADKLEIEITKDGNLASFTQLSKGQRCILKLCFGVSIMQTIQNHHGLHIDQLFFDESLDGTDDDIKVKALKLFETLALNHSSIFLVEHSSEIKARLDNKYSVSLVNGTSQIEKD